MPCFPLHEQMQGSNILFWYHNSYVISVTDSLTWHSTSKLLFVTGAIHKIVAHGSIKLVYTTDKLLGD